MCNTFEMSICCAICICRLFRVLIRAFLLLHRFQNMHSTRSLSTHYWMPFNEFVWCMCFLALVCRCICHFEWIALLFCAPIRIQQPNRLHSLKIEINANDNKKLCPWNIVSVLNGKAEHTHTGKQTHSKVLPALASCHLSRFVSSS